jgi:DNA-binding NtrC family response regulator
MTEPTTPRILIADDEPLYRKTTGELLTKAGYECVLVSDAHDALDLLSREPFDLILSDLNMPGNRNLELLHRGRERWPSIPLIVITGVPSLPTAIESVRLGIADYLLKPVKPDDLLSCVRHVLARWSQGERVDDRSDDEKLALAAKFPRITGSSPPMRELFDLLDRVAGTDTNLLITGESGTGKEVVARSIHERSARAEHPYQVIDCTAVPETLFESLLFGHVKGSFTGAVSDQVGLLSQAHLGTAFFDEIGELSIPLQAKLLRVVQERTFIPIGKTQPEQVDARFICATNRDLELEVQAGNFRRDLFYRLAVVQIELPPLRRRQGDIPLLAENFLQTLRPSHSPVERISDEVLARFEEYDWPGNVRELRNVIEHSLALARTERIELGDLPPRFLEVSRRSVPSVELGEGSREEILDEAEHQYLIGLLTRHRGNVSQVAREANMSRQGMHNLLKKHNLSAADYRDQNSQ